MALKRKQLKLRQSSRNLNGSLDVDKRSSSTTGIEGRIGQLEERIIRFDGVIDALLHRSYNLHAVVAFITFEEVEGLLVGR